MEVPKRMLYVVTKGNWGGAQRYVFDLACAAKRAGHEPVVAYGQEGGLGERLRAEGIATLPLASLARDVGAGDLAAYRELYRAINATGPDVVHLNSSKAGVLGALAARILKVQRIVFTAHGWAFNEDRGMLSKLFIWCAHYLTVLLCHRTIVVSRALLLQTRSMPLVQQKIQLIHLGIAAPDLLAKEVAREQLLARTQPLPPGALWVGVLAELTWNKGLHHVIRALGELKRQGLSLSLLVLGEGEERRFLHTLIEEQNLAQEVRLMGFVPNGSRYLPAFDIFALPSHTEALSYALIEAGFAGLPVVASRVGGIPEVVEHNVSGLLVPRGNVAKLAAALRTLAEDPARRTQFGVALKQSTQEKFGLERMVAETFATY